jgi:signal recognition particle receptor subunit beta
VSRREFRGQLISLAPPEERTLFFDLMPVDLGSFRGYRMRLHLCTVPGQVALGATRHMILRGTDGLVFVADSQRAAVLPNQFSYLDMAHNLKRHNREASDIPTVVQFNKRDLPDILSVYQLRQSLGLPESMEHIEAAASVGYGVSKTLKSLVRKVVRRIGDPAHLPEVDPSWPSTPRASRPSWLPPAARVGNVSEFSAATYPTPRLLEVPATDERGLASTRIA